MRAAGATVARSTPAMHCHRRSASKGYPFKSGVAHFIFGRGEPILVSLVCLGLWETFLQDVLGMLGIGDRKIDVSP